MRKLLPSLTVAALLLPILTSALDYVPHTSYKDVSAGSREAAGIAVLTNVGAVQGYAGNQFRPQQLLNRAEFLKIVLASMPKADLPGSDPLSIPPRSCFPDVKADDWFAQYVCYGKSNGIINGNPDGLFHPERPVNNAEALKILTLLYGYELTHSPGDQWYTPYMRAADTAGTSLEVNVGPATNLTRGQMARLAAAFLAKSQGELSTYRKAEAGDVAASSSRSSSSKSGSSSSSMGMSSSSSSLSSKSSSSASSSTSSIPLLPVRSQFLVLGTRSQPIAGLKLFADKEAVFVRSVRVVMERKINSFDAMFLIDETGKELGQVTLDHIYDNNDKTWRASFSGDSSYRIPKGEERVLALVVRLKERGKGGVSDELVQVDSIDFTMQGEDSGSNYTGTSYGIVMPKHQTAQGRVTRVVNALSDTDSIPLGTQQLVAGFTFEGTHVPEADLRIRDLEFQVSKSSTVNVSNWQLGSSDSSDRVPCTVNELIVTCSSITPELGTITSGPRTLRLFADVALDAGAVNPSLQISINQPGVVGEYGAIRWTDGSGIFTWTEFSSPIARSTRFQ